MQQMSNMEHYNFNEKYQQNEIAQEQEAVNDATQNKQRSAGAP